MSRSSPVLVALVAALSTTCVASTQTPPSPQSTDVVARVDGKAITAADVDAKWRELDAAGFVRFSQEQFEARRRALDVMINEALLGRAAKAKGLTLDVFVQQETAKRSRPVTDAEIEQTYRSMQSRFPNSTLDQLREPIRAYLAQQQRDTVVRALVDEERKAGATVEIVLDPPRQKIATESTDPVLGPTSAEVEIVEFSDFQCPFCLSVTPTLRQIRTTFGDKVKLVYRDLPLSIHANAFQAAEAAQCAHQQGKFWPYHDKLFANQKALDTTHLKQYATEVGVEMNAFNACLDQRKTKTLIEQDMKSAQQHGVESTPAFFVNGRMLLGAQPFESFRQAIQDELDRKKTTGK
jgi:protein-disulfide isomerase